MTTLSKSGLTVDAYHTMLTIRRFEEKVRDLRSHNEIAGSVHLCLGQESVPTATLAALQPQDRIVATYRGHGWALASGVDPEALLAEICQRATGVNGGRGGSAYLSDPERRFFGENSIVGGGLPIADGLALAAQVHGTDAVVAVCFGDGATSQGAAHEALVMAVALRLPVIFVCENNRWSEMTPIASVLGKRAIFERAAGYGMPASAIDGTDLDAVHGAVSEAATLARGDEGPSFIECHVPRLGGHYNADVQQYRSERDQAEAAERDPVANARASLVKEGVPGSELDEIDAAVQQEIERLASIVAEAPLPDPSTAAEHVVGDPRQTTQTGMVPERPTDAKRLTYANAINEALARELEERTDTVLFGEDVAIPGGVFGVTRGLRERFGAERVFDTPIAESAILGTAVGAALAGLRPIVEIMWADFLLVALDQLVNQAANVRYLSRGKLTAPMLVRCQQGATPGSCAQHSQSLEALLAHVAGLKVGMPSTPADAYTMTRAAIADPDPVVLIESRGIYGRHGAVNLDAPAEPVGGARLRREGDDIALISWGRMLDAACDAAEQLSTEGVEASVLDLRWLSPLDDDAIANVVSRCQRVLIVHEANVTGGFGAEVAARIAGRHLFELDGPVRRLGSPDVRYPSAPALQDALLPGVTDVLAAAREAMLA